MSLPYLSLLTTLQLPAECEHQMLSCIVCAVERRQRQHSPTSLGLGMPDQMHFSSSSISFSTGPGGLSRASASRTTLAPGGVAEHQKRSYDGRTGQHRALHQQAVNGRVRKMSPSSAEIVPALMLLTQVVKGPEPVLPSIVARTHHEHLCCSYGLG